MGEFEQLPAGLDISAVTLRRQELKVLAGQLDMSALRRIPYQHSAPLEAERDRCRTSELHRRTGRIEIQRAVWTDDEGGLMTALHPRHDVFEPDLRNLARARIWNGENLVVDDQDT